MRRGDPEGHGDHQKKNTEEQRIKNRKTLGQELINRPGGVGRTLTRHGTEKRHRKRSGSSAVTGTNQQSNYGPRENIWTNKGTGSGPRGPILRGRGGRPRGDPHRSGDRHVFWTTPRDLNHKTRGAGPQGEGNAADQGGRAATMGDHRSSSSVREYNRTAAWWPTISLSFHPSRPHHDGTTFRT